MTRTSTTTATHPIGRSSAHNRFTTGLDLAGFHSRPGHRDNASDYAANGWGHGGRTNHGWGYGG